jgi:pyridoxamine 5'-phosphate oxidase
MMQDESLPEPLPADPLSLFSDWFHDARARRTQPNPDAMVLATIGGDGRPSARVVLCKQLATPAGYVVFYTNYRSRKARELDLVARAAAVFHWDALHRQVRIEGPVLRSPELESDQYFASRALESRISAWASAQSEPLASRSTLARRVQEVTTRFSSPGTGNPEVPRPPHWGGYRLWIDAIELWMEGPGRVHDRARWTRSLARHDEFGFEPGQWQGTRLNP